MKLPGYIAITTSLVLSFLILILTTSVGFSAWFSRFGSLNSTSKQISYYVAETCLEKARLKLAQNGSYAGGENITFSSYSCFINTVTAPPGQRVIKVRAQVLGATTNLQLTVNYPQLQTISLEEVVKF